MRDSDNAFLVQLSDRLRPLSDPIEIQYEAACMLGDQLGANRVGYAEDMRDGERVRVTRNYTNGVPSIEGVYRYVDYGLGLVQQLRAGQTVSYRDVANDRALSDAERAAHAFLQLGATINVPLVKAGQLVAILFVHFRAAKRWSNDELMLLEEVAQRVWSHVERAKAEAALRESEQLYRTLFDAIDDGLQLARVELRPDGAPFDVRLIEVNSAWGRMTGIPPEHARGKLLWSELLPGLDPSWLEHFARVVITRQSSRFEGYASPFDRWLDCHIVPFGYASTGEIVAVFRDFSGRRRAEQALQNSESKYRLLFESIDAGFCIIDVLFDADERPYDYRFIEVNPAFERQTGLTEAVGLTMRSLVPGHEQHWYDAYGDVAKSGEPRRFEHRADALGRSYDVYAFRIGPPGQPLVAVLFNDITERQRTEQQLRDTDRRKDEFLAILGHELRNPLAAIRSASELMKVAAPGDARLMRAQGVLERQSAHMAHLIDGLLEVSRIARGKIEIEREVLDARQIVSTVLQDRASQIEARKLAVHTELSREPLWAAVDPVRIAQVLDNLLGNALKFTPEGGAVWLSARAEQGMVVLRLRDNGVGIRPALIDQLFEPFQQDVQDIARGSGGLGLGLALAKGLVELHGGSIEAHSAGPGQGAEFVVRLEQAVGPHEMPQPTAAKPVSARRVLIVEDNDDAAEMLSALLEMRGHSVRVANSGDDALDLLRAEPADVVVCDIGLPGMNGYELAEQVRSDPQLRGLRMIALSGYGQPDDRRRSQEAGFDHHLVKPVDPSLLDAVIGGELKT